MYKNNFQKIIATFLLSLVLFSNTSCLITVASNSVSIYSEDDTKPTIPPITYH